MINVIINISFRLCGWSVSISNSEGWRKAAKSLRYAGPQWTTSSVPSNGRPLFATIVTHRVGWLKAEKMFITKLGEIASGAAEYSIRASCGDREFTAVCFVDDEQELLLYRAALEHGLGDGIEDPEWRLHHVTLNMGDARASRMGFGCSRALKVTHVGRIPGRVAAFRVSGAEDSINPTPHITACVAKGVSGRESNDITEWTEIEPFDLWGVVDVVGK